jgi:hypothetical protein
MKRSEAIMPHHQDDEERRRDAWARLVADGRKLAQRRGNAFALGDLALQAEKVSPPDDGHWLDRFARDIHLDPYRLAGYVAVAIKWPPSKRIADLPWTCHRDAAGEEALRDMARLREETRLRDEAQRRRNPPVEDDPPSVDQHTWAPSGDRALSLVDSAALDAHHSAWTALKVLQGLDLERVGKLLTESERAEYASNAAAMGRWLDRYREMVRGG